jgi:hypothetical protein
MPFEIKKSKQVEEYLHQLYDKLEIGNNSQLFEAFIKACDKILNNPISPDFIKSNLGEYRAVDVLAQKRAFFKIYGEYSVVFIVWLNPDQFPHDSSKGDFDLCYREFQNLLKSEKIEVYVPEKVEEPDFKLHGKFRKNTSIFTSLKTAKSFSQAQLSLVERSPNEYELRHISESVYYSDSLPILFERVAAEAKKENIELFCFVAVERDFDFRVSVTNALTSAGFSPVEEDSFGVMYKVAA